MDTQEAPPEKRAKMEEVIWQKKKNNFTSKVYKNIYLNEKTADVYFLCGTGDEQERIPAHRNILSNASPVFDAMFYGPTATELDKEYPGTSPNVFKDFLKLCYLDEVIIGPKNIIEVMKLAHEFQMIDSLKFCGELWADNMTIDDVCCAYHWAIHLEMDELKEFCERKISVFPKEVFKTTHFLCCDHSVLNHILDLETLLCDERIVLQACLNWASEACERDELNASELENLQKYLEDSLYKIRYSSMTSKEFLAVMDSKVGHFFDIKDYEDIIRLTTGESKLRTVRFNPNPRSSVMAWKEDCAILWDVLKCSSRYELSISNGSEFEFGIRCSRTILLGGFHWTPINKKNSVPTAMLLFGSVPTAMSLFGSVPTAMLTITQKSTTGKKSTVHTIDYNEGGESCIDLGNSPIIIRPESIHRISFKFSFSREIKVEGIVKYEELKLDEGTTIGFSGSGFGIMRGFKFNLL